MKALASLLTVTTFCRANLLFTRHQDGETKAQLQDRLPKHLPACNPDDPSLICKSPTLLQISGQVLSLRPGASLAMQSLLCASETVPIEWEIDWKMVWVQGNNSPKLGCNRIIHLRDIFPCQSKCNYVRDMKEQLPKWRNQLILIVSPRTSFPVKFLVSNKDRASAGFLLVGPLLVACFCLPAYFHTAEKFPTFGCATSLTCVARQITIANGFQKSWGKG